jgi:uncharacterized membrane protein YgcG
MPKTADIEFSTGRREGIRAGQNKVYNPITKTGFVEEVTQSSDRSRQVSDLSMSNFRLPKFLNISVGVTFIESRNTTTRLYDFGTSLSNEVSPTTRKSATSDGNKQNNAAGGGGAAGGGTQGPVPVKNVEKKIKGTNVPDGTKQVQFGGGSFGGGGAGGGF